MLAYFKAVRQTAKQIAKATDNAVRALRSGRVEQEPAMTDRMLGAIEQSLSDFSVHGIQWSAKTLTDRGANSQESVYGADFLGVLNINLPGFNISKGFLAQAKLLKNGLVKDPRLKDQCRRMLALTPDSFVFLYSKEGIRVVPAISVVATDADPTELYDRSVQVFFEEHLECFIGDAKISEPSAKSLFALANELRIPRALMLEATPRS